MVNVTTLRVATNDYVGGRTTSTFLTADAWGDRYGGMIPLLRRGSAIGQLASPIVLINQFRQGRPPSHCTSKTSKLLVTYSSSLLPLNRLCQLPTSLLLLPPLLQPNLQHGSTSAWLLILSATNDWPVQAWITARIHDCLAPHPFLPCRFRLSSSSFFFHKKKQKGLYQKPWLEGNQESRRNNRPHQTPSRHHQLPHLT